MLFLPGMNKQHLLSIPFFDWKNVFLQFTSSPYRAVQTREWVFHHLVSDFKKMSNLPITLQSKLDEKLEIRTLKIVDKQVSQDGTVKWALKTFDNLQLECVMIPDEKRFSVCLSSQIGCAMGCKFCNTAKMGFIRNLSLGEILEQVFIVNAYIKKKFNKKLTNAIFMGMGEPLQNIDAVANTCHILSAKEGFGLSKRKITVSTSGILPKILEWAQIAPDYKLAISLNGSTDALRSDIMPIGKRYPLSSLLQTIDTYISITGQKITFEYILIRGKTCTAEGARGLVKIVSQRDCKVNLIAFNSGAGNYCAPSEEQVFEFLNILKNKQIPFMLRKPRGRDIFAACGQLVQQQKKVA